MFLSVFFFRNSLQFKKVSLPLQPQTRNNGAIAQLVEQRTENPCVPGSIPGGTTFQKQSECSAVGSALRSGRRGRAFESPHSDRRRQAVKIACRFFFSTFANRCKSAENPKNFILVFCSIIIIFLVEVNSTRID